MHSTLLEMDLVDANVLAKVRETFYRLDTRAAGFLSTEGLLALHSVKKGGARCRWHYAVTMTVRARRVVARLRESREQRRDDGEAAADTAAGGRSVPSSPLPQRAAAALAAAPAAGRCMC